ncbi:MAG: N-acetylmuramoyl-L-alanine amidase [Mycobacteriales bacterium]
MPTPLRVLSYNVKRPDAKRSASDIAKYLAGVLEQHHVDVAALQEVSACRTALRAIPGYTLREFDDRSGGDNAILIRNGLGAGDGWDIEVPAVGGWWTAQRGGKMWGRSHVTVRVEWCRITTVHFPPAIDFKAGKVIGPAIRAAVYALQLRQLSSHVKAFRREPAHILLGDWNERDTDNGAISPGGWARRAGLTLLGGSRIDWAAGRGLTASRPVVIEVGQGGNTSDHPVVLWTLTPAFTTPAPAPARTPVPKPATVPVPTPEVTVSRLPADLPQRLRDAGLKVSEVPGWRTRGRPAATGGFAPVGVLAHHTATTARTDDANVVALLVRGRSDLPGPLCHLGLARDGTVYVIASGRANHAGRARPSGTVAGGDGNSLYIGIEAFNDGVGEKWPAVQYDAYVRLAAALCALTGNSAETVRGHKETSVTGKIDPRFDMGAFRARVKAAMSPGARPKPPAPAKPAEVVNHVTKGRALIRQGLAELRKAPETRKVVHSRADEIDAILRKVPTA